MLATDIAQKLLETDQDFDPLGDIKRYVTSKYPTVEIESEFNHWNVYHVDPLARMKVGTIYFDDMSEAPEMTPEQRAVWDANRWTAVPSVMREPTAHATFEEAVDALVPPAARKVIPEAADPDDPTASIEQLAKEKAQEPEFQFQAANGRKFRVKIVWDEPAGGTAYDAKGNVVPETFHPTVKFYDMTHADDPKFASFKGKGQFVASYYAATLMERPHGGLDLHGGEPVWKIDDISMTAVRLWIRHEVEEKRGYRLKKELFGMQYEAIDPDDPELYAHPERYSQQPNYEKMESELRVMLRPYYPRVTISKRPAKFAHLFKGLPEYYTWTIHGHRDTPLPLPKTVPNQEYGEKLDWRAEIKNWFLDWAARMGVHLEKFEIYGRIRTDPTFQFNTHLTWRKGVGLYTGEPLKESEDISPEDYFTHHVDTLEWHRDLEHALREFHPYGTSYQVLNLGRGAFVVATTYFPPDKDNFGQRFRAFVEKWVTNKRVMPMNYVKLYSFQHANRPEYPQWSVIAAINVEWPDKSVEEHPSAPPA